MTRLRMAAVKLWLLYAITGSVTGVSALLVHNSFTTDLLFELWEMGITLLTPALVAVLLNRITRTGMKSLLTVSYLTLFMPVLGPMFGGTGNEPLWAFAVLGVIGGLVWGSPFAVTSLIKSRKDRESTGGE